MRRQAVGARFRRSHLAVLACAFACTTSQQQQQQQQCALPPHSTMVMQGPPVCDDIGSSVRILLSAGRRGRCDGRRSVRASDVPTLPTRSPAPPLSSGSRPVLALHHDRMQICRGHRALGRNFAVVAGERCRRGGRCDRQPLDVSALLRFDVGARVQLACVVPPLIVVDTDPISACKGKSGERWVELGDPTRRPPITSDRRVGPRT